MTVVCLLCIHLRQLPSNIIAMQAGTCPYRKVTTHHYYCLFWQLMLKTLKAGRINTELRMAADSDNGGFQDNIWRLYLAE